MTAKRILLAVTGILSASVLALVGLAVVDNTAQAQGASLQPANVRVVNGPNAGEAVVSWDAVTGAAYYRVGWVSAPNFGAVTGAGRDWREAFYFVDLKNAGQTSFTVSRLEPGALHLFLVGGNSSLYGQPQWSDLESLTLNSDTTACPTPTPTPGATATPTPGATATATPTPSATPTPTPGATTAPTPLPAVTGGDYDYDNDGLIEIRTIAQLDAIRHDLDGDGVTDDAKNAAAAYAAAFPGAATSMGCPDAGCTGYELANNLDYGTQISAQGWQPIGYWISSYDEAVFTATFDGGGYTISNLFISRATTYHVGLFGRSGGTIRRAALLNVNVVGNADVGGLVGSNTGTVADSSVTGSVIGNGDDVGGLVGQNYDGGAITNSNASTEVTGVYDVGGLVGENFADSTITDSHATGSVTSDDGSGYPGDRVGGLVGANAGSIADSYATGVVSAGTNNTKVGGLVGQNTEGGSITDSYASGAVTAGQIVGGLVGNNNSGGITDSYATGDVTAYWTVGGLVGESSSGSIIRSHATGAVSGGRSEAGGLVGDNDSAITASYATGDVTSPGLTGGLVGYNGGNGVVSASCAVGDVASEQGVGGSYYEQYVGGLVGWNEGTINGSYAAGDVFSQGGHRDGYAHEDFLAGLVATNNGTVTASYAVGKVSAASGAEYVNLAGLMWEDSGVVRTSYWNTETSGQDSSAGGVGKTTAQLQTPTGNTGIYATWNPGWWDFGTSGQYPALKTLSLSVAAQRGQATAAQPGAGNAADRAALVALYNSTGGANWTNNSNWMSDQPAGQWHGVATDTNGRVIGLELDTNGLSGSLPAELGSLDRLTILRMGSNDLTGPIPAELGNLSNLSILGLGNNQLTGSIPAELGNLSGLTRVSMWNNQLSGPIPSELGNLSRLTKLSLGSNQLSGPIPSSLGNLSSLESLGLQRNGLIGAIPATLGSLSNLTWLDFDFNELSGPIPPELGNLSNLTVLRLGSNQMSGSVPPELGNLSNLSILGLGNNQLTGSIPPQLGSLVSLTRFSLWNNDATGPIPAELGNLSRLTKLSLGSNALTGDIPSSLGNLSNLKELGLQSNDLSGPIPAQLGNLASLTNLSLNGNQLTGAVPAELGSLAALTRLYLQGNQLSGTIPAELGRLSKLDVLNLSHNQLTGAIPSALAAGSTARAVPPGNGLTGYDAVERGGAFPAIEIAYAGPGRWAYGQTPEQAGALSSLRVLNLSYNRLSGALPASLGSLASLKRLYLNRNQFAGTIPAALDRLNLQTKRVDKKNEDKECGYLSPDSNIGVQNDRATLQYLYGATDGRSFFNIGRTKPQWSNHSGWEETYKGDASIPLSQWHGVTVNSHGRVSELRLGDNGLVGDTSNWHEDLATRSKDTIGISDDPLFCLEVLELRDNGLGGNIGAVLSEIYTPGEVELRFKGNSFDNWLDDDPDSVTLENAASHLADALEMTTSSKIDLTLFADPAMQVLRLTAKSRVAGILAKTGARVTLVGSFLSHDHEEVTEALIQLMFAGREPACLSLLSNVQGKERYCETGFLSDVEEAISFWNNNCAVQPCNQGCPKRPACSGQ